MKNELTERERKIFEYLVSGGENLAVTRIHFNGIITSCIVVLDQNEDGSYNIVPFAVLVNEHIFSLLESIPAEDEEEESTNEVTLLKLKRK